METTAYNDGYNLYREKPIAERVRIALKEGRLLRSLWEQAMAALQYSIVTPYHELFSKNLSIAGIEYKYLTRAKNALGGRIVEIPFAYRFYLENKTDSFLEFGNVLSNYVDIRHDVIDKYEKAEGIINEDIVNFKPDRKYDLIISISTLEHVGFDEDVKDSTKVAKAFDNLKSLLNDKGKLLLMIPLGYNPAVDELIESHRADFSQSNFLFRRGSIADYLNDWKEGSYAEVSKYQKENSSGLHTMAFLVYEKGYG